jgi:hypothetical protein
MKKYVVEGMFWIPSYRDFDCWDTIIEANSLEEAKEKFKKNPMSQFAKREPYIGLYKQDKIEA